MKNKKGIIFDLDETLYTAKYLKLYLLYKSRHDLLLLKNLEKTRNKIREKIYDSGNDLLEDLYKNLSQKTKYSIEYIEDWYQKKFYNFFINGIKSFGVKQDGINEVLLQLSNNGFKLGIISDYSKIEKRLDVLGIPAKLFDDILSSEDEGALKPNTKAYEKMLKKWGLCYNNCLIVGDKEETDVEVAKRLNIDYIKLSKNRIDPIENTYNWKYIKNKFVTQSLMIKNIQ